MRTAHIDYRYWLTSSPIDEWQRWTPLCKCDNETVYEAMKLFIEGVDDFSRKVDWNLRDYTLYVFEDPLAVGFKADNNGTVNVFTNVVEHRHKDIYHEFGEDWEVSGKAYTRKRWDRQVVFT